MSRLVLDGCFNEAGAISAGKHFERLFNNHISPGFNEAGAISAGKPLPKSGSFTRRKMLQ